MVRYTVAMPTLGFLARTFCRRSSSPVCSRVVKKVSTTRSRIFEECRPFSFSKARREPFQPGVAPASRSPEVAPLDRTEGFAIASFYQKDRRPTRVG